MGAIPISDHLSWVSSNWAHDALLRHLAVELEPQRPDLAAALTRGQLARHGYVTFDLRSADAGTFCTVLAAASHAYDQAFAVGPNSFAEPEFWFGFMQEFSEFVALLRRDPRNHEPFESALTTISEPQQTETVPRAENFGRIRGPSGTIWEKPGWLFDLVIEHLAVELVAVHLPLGDKLLLARTRAGGGAWDASQLRVEERHCICLAVTELHDRYAKHHRNSATVRQLQQHAEVFAEIAEAYAALRLALACPDEGAKPA